MRKGIFFTVFILFSGMLSAQRDTLPENAVYAEAGGNALYYSVNYARFIRWTPVAKSFHAGFSYFPGAGNSYQEKAVFIPIEGTLLFGKHRHFFEAGLGFTFFSRIVQYHQSPGGYMMGLSDGYKRSSGFNLNARVGYCFLPARSNRVTIRIGFTPVYFAKAYYYNSQYPYKNQVVLPWAGFSLGYAF